MHKNPKTKKKACIPIAPSAIENNQCHLTPSFFVEHNLHFYQFFSSITAANYLIKIHVYNDQCYPKFGK